MLEMITTTVERAVCIGKGGGGSISGSLLQSKWKKCKSAEKMIAAQTSFMCYVLICSRTKSTDSFFKRLCLFNEATRRLFSLYTPQFFSYWLFSHSSSSPPSSSSSTQQTKLRFCNDLGNEDGNGEDGLQRRRTTWQETEAASDNTADDEYSQERREKNSPRTSLGWSLFSRMCTTITFDSTYMCPRPPQIIGEFVEKSSWPNKFSFHFSTMSSSSDFDIQSKKQN